MQDPEICRELLERIFPGKKVEDLKFCSTSNPLIQKSILTGVIEKGVRLDVLFSGDNTWYDIEMQRASHADLPKRGRYYSSAMDIDQAAKGTHYNKLKTNFVISICTFDYYGMGKAMYSFMNYDQKNHLPFGDDSFKIILNTSCAKEDTPLELRSFFSYINKMQVEENDGFIAKIHNQVVKFNTPDWRRQIMTLEEEMNTIRIDALEEGRRAGLSQGLAEGRNQGLAEGLSQGIAEGLAQAYHEVGLAREDTACKLHNKLDISKEDVEKVLDKFW